MAITTPDYIDDYGTCDETYSTLRVYHETLPPTNVTKRLSLEPHKQQFKDEDNSSKGGVSTLINGWFLSTQDKVDSLDSRRHIDWLISQVGDRRHQIEKMHSDGFEIDITSYWLSRSGHGGPTISPHQMRALSMLGIEVNWDVYFHEGED